MIRKPENLPRFIKFASPGVVPGQNDGIRKGSHPQEDGFNFLLSLFFRGQNGSCMSKLHPGR